MNTLPCDVVLLPSDELAQKAIAASQSLAPFDPLFTLEIGAFYPHMSLYMFQLDEATVPEVEKALAEIAQSLQTIYATATKYTLGTGFGVGYVDPEYETSDELETLQDRVIQAINPLRAGMRESDKAKMQEAEGIKLANLQKYGYPAAYELFRPHVTLTRLAQHTPAALDVLPDITTFSGAFTRLGLFEMGTNGTCIREIKTFEL
jgi:2'-5' RNA ligase